jgi:hypothetical protein
MAAPNAPTNLRLGTASGQTLYASTTVSGLQFDIVTTGSITNTLGENFTLESATVGVNTLRVLVYTAGDYTFNGAFATVNAAITSVSSVVGSDAVGDEVEVNVTY